MENKVKLSDIIDGLECQSDESRSFLNKNTGEIFLITDEEFRAIEDDEPIEKFPQWEHENIKIAREILETDNYIALPTRFDIHEYSIMKKFCLSIKNEEVGDILYNSIQGSGAFRRFKENISRYDIRDDWYIYRDKAMREIAIEWCRDNNIEYEEEKNS